MQCFVDVDVVDVVDIVLKGIYVDCKASTFDGAVRSF